MALCRITSLIFSLGVYSLSFSPVYFLSILYKFGLSSFSLCGSVRFLPASWFLVLYILPHSFYLSRCEGVIIIRTKTISTLICYPFLLNHFQISEINNTSCPINSLGSNLKENVNNTFNNSFIALVCYVKMSIKVNPRAKSSFSCYIKVHKERKNLLNLFFIFFICINTTSRLKDV